MKNYMSILRKTSKYVFEFRSTLLFFTFFMVMQAQGQTVFTVPLTICAPQKVTFISTTDITDPIYSWTLIYPDNSIQSSANTNFDFTFQESGNYKVTLTVTSSSNSNSFITVPPKDITVGQTPTVTITNKNDSICSDSISKIKVISGSNVTYSWTRLALPSGVSIVDDNAEKQSGNNYIPATKFENNTTSPLVVKYALSLNDGGSCTGVDTASVTVFPTPVLKLTAAELSIISCTDQLLSFFIKSSSNSVKWTTDGAAYGAKNGAGNTIVNYLVNKGNEPLYIHYTLTPYWPRVGQGNPKTLTVTVNPKLLSATVEKDTICSGDQINISIQKTPADGGTCTWRRWVDDNEFSGVITSNQPYTGTGATITEVLTNTSFAPAKVYYTITATGSCGKDSVTAEVIVLPRAIVTINNPSTKKDTICSGEFANIEVTTPTENFPGTLVNPPGTGTGCSFSIVKFYTEPSIVTGKVTGFKNDTSDHCRTYKIQQALTNTGDSIAEVRYVITPKFLSCEGQPDTVLVYVKPAPKIAIANSIDTICSGYSTNIALSTTNKVPVTYTWTAKKLDEGKVDFTENETTHQKSSSIIQEKITNNSDKNIRIKYSIVPFINGCAGDTLNKIIVVNPVPKLTIDNPTKDEGVGKAFFTVSLSQPVACDVTFWVHTKDSTAMSVLKPIQDYDYIGVQQPDGKVSTDSLCIIPAGQTSTQVYVTIVKDRIVEPTEYFIGILSTPVNATIADGYGVFGIANNGDDNVIHLKPFMNAKEPSTDGSFKVELDSIGENSPDRAICMPIMVYYTISGSATKNVDFQMADSVIIPAMQFHATIPVKVLNDTISECLENVTITCTGSNAGRLGFDTGSVEKDTTPATINIADDDADHASVSIAPATAKEGEDLVFKVTLSNVSQDDITLVLKTKDGTAKNGEDYTGGDYTVTIPHGQKTVDVHINTTDDNLVELDETMILMVDTITLGCADYNANTQAIGTIQNVKKPTILKKGSKPKLNQDGRTYELVYTLVVENTTDAALQNVQIEEHLDTTFQGKNCEYEVRSIQASGNWSANTSFNGSSVFNTLNDGAALAIGTKNSVTITLDVAPNFNQDSVVLYNQVQLMASGVKPIPSNVVRTVIYPIPLFFPEGFSPDGDGTNDFYVVNRPGNIRIEIEFFNRWGDSVYKSSNYQNDWDGTRSGTRLTEGTYFAKYKAIIESKGEVILSGIKSISIRW